MFTRRRLLQSVDNQQWLFLPTGQLEASGYHVPGEEQYWCLDASLRLTPCLSTLASKTFPSSAVSSIPPDQLWSYNSTTRLLRNSGRGQCLSSSPPAPGPSSTRATLGVRIGGDLSPDESSPPGVVRAYNTNWYDWGYFFSIDISGHYTLARGSSVVASGMVPGGVELLTWYKVGIEMRGARLRVFVEGNLLVDWTDPQPQLERGWVGIGSGWHRTQFDDVLLQRLDLA